MSEYVIDSYKDRLLIDYIKPGGKYLVRFFHGAGDAIMFMPLLDRLRILYPECTFDLYVGCGQEKIWTSVAEVEPPGYNHIFVLHYPMAEGSNMLKSEKCAYSELGLSPDQIADLPEVAQLPTYPSPLVGIHYHGTALPDSVGCDEPIAKQIWQEVKDCGLIPIETHFLHGFRNPVNKRYNWIDLSVRNYRATLENLFGLIQRCHAFIGVASGPFVAALSYMPTRTLYLEKHHPLRTYTRRSDVASVNILDYRVGQISEWLEGLEK